MQLHVAALQQHPQHVTGPQGRVPHDGQGERGSAPAAGEEAVWLQGLESDQSLHQGKTGCVKIQSRVLRPRP